MSLSLPSSPAKSFNLNHTIHQKSRDISNTYTVIEHDVDSSYFSSSSLLPFESPVSFIVTSPLSMASEWLGGFMTGTSTAGNGGTSTSKGEDGGLEADEKLDQLRVNQSEIRHSNGPVLQTLRPISKLVMDSTLLFDRTCGFPECIEEEQSNGESQRSTSISSNSTSTSTTSSIPSELKRHRRSRSCSIASFLPIHYRSSQSSSRSLSSSSSILSKPRTISKPSTISITGLKSTVTSSITRASASCISASVATGVSNFSKTQSPISSYHSIIPSTSKDNQGISSSSTSLNVKAPFRNPFSSIAEQELRIAQAHIFLKEDAARRRVDSMKGKGFGIKVKEAERDDGNRKRSWSMGGDSNLRLSPSIRITSHKAIPSPSFRPSSRGNSGLPTAHSFENRHKRSATTSDVTSLVGIAPAMRFEMRARLTGSCLGVEKPQTRNSSAMISPRSGLNGEGELFGKQIGVESNRSGSLYNLPSNPNLVDARSASLGRSSFGSTHQPKSEKMLLRPSPSLSAHLSQQSKFSGMREEFQPKVLSTISIRERRIASAKLKREKEMAEHREASQERQRTTTQAASQIRPRLSSGKVNEQVKIKSYRSTSFIAPSAPSSSAIPPSRSSNFSRSSYSYATKPREFREPLPPSSSSPNRLDRESLKRSNSASTSLLRSRSTLPPLSPPTSPIYQRGGRNGEEDQEDEPLTIGGILKKSHTISSGLAGFRSILNSGSTLSGGSQAWPSRIASTPARWRDQAGEPLTLNTDLGQPSLRVYSHEELLPSPISPLAPLSIDTHEQATHFKTSQRGFRPIACEDLETPPLTATSNASSTLQYVGQYLSSKASSIPTSSSVQSLLSFNFNLSPEELVSNGQEEKKIPKSPSGYLSPPPLPSWNRKRSKSPEETVKTRVTSPSWNDHSPSCPSIPLPSPISINLMSSNSPSSSSFGSSSGSSRDRANMRPHPQSDWSINQVNQKDHRDRRVAKNRREREVSQRSLVSLKEHHGENDQSHDSPKRYGRGLERDEENGLVHAIQFSSSNKRAIHSHSSIEMPNAGHQEDSSLTSHQPRRSKTYEDPNFNRKQSFSSITSTSSSPASPAQSQSQYRPAFRSHATFSEHDDDEWMTWECQLSSF